MANSNQHGEVRIIDLRFGVPGTIASFLLPSSAGPVLIETGPDSTFANLKQGLRTEGVEPEEVRHVLLTHIHLDHAGAAWRLAALGATVYVHPVGAPHLADPARLLASAARIYGERMETLWGRLEPIQATRLRAVEDREVLRIGDRRFEALHTPGHASHHIAWRLDGAVFTGDVGGVRMGEGPVVPPCPPPDIDLEAWRASVATLRRVGAETLYATHFGAFDDVSGQLDAVEESLERLASWVRDRMREGRAEEDMVPAFERFTAEYLVARGCGEDLRERYALANPAFMSVAGLVRYWRERQGVAAPRHA
jgi:glyoxylase-like metal-dependent hydrolase (beta-lactamase superfamily II)